MARTGQKPETGGRARTRAAPAKTSPKPAARPAPARTPRAPEPAGRLRAKGREDPQTGRSRAEEAMEKRLDTLDRGTPRYEALRSAISFKRSWLELAQRLSAVTNDGSFKEWGYRTFEAYALHELHLKKDTAQKLVRSYDFLATHERRLLEASEKSSGAPAAPLPSFQALDVLAEARKNPYLSESDYRELRDQVFHEDPTPAQVRKAVRDKAPEPPAAEEKQDPAERVRRCLNLAERLLGIVMETDDLPSRIPEALEEVVGGLRQLLEE
jgi:hypothetical protein